MHVYALREAAYICASLLSPTFLLLVYVEGITHAISCFPEATLRGKVLFFFVFVFLLFLNGSLIRTLFDRHVYRFFFFFVFN